jgi:hypothetical protein
MRRNKQIENGGDIENRYLHRKLDIVFKLLLKVLLFLTRAQNFKSLCLSVPDTCTAGGVYEWIECKKHLPKIYCNTYSFSELLYNLANTYNKRERKRLKHSLAPLMVL